jgi:hypothetical protein
VYPVTLIFSTGCMPFHVDDEKFDAPGGIPFNLYLYGTSLAVFGGPMNEAKKQCYHRYIPAGYFYGFLNKYKHLFDHGTFALEVDEKGYAPPVGGDEGHLSLTCFDEKGHFLKGTQASPMRVSLCMRFANSKPEHLEMHAKAVATLEAEPVSDLEAEDELVEDAQGASKGASKGASTKKRGSKPEHESSESDEDALKRPRTEHDFPRGWKGSGVDKTFAPTEDYVVHTSILSQGIKLERGLTFIVHSNDGTTSTEVLVLLVYISIQTSRLFALCTDRPSNGTAAEWASPDICSAPRLLKVQPSSPFRGNFPFSTLEMQAFMTMQNTSRESVKYSRFWNGVPKKPDKKPHKQTVADNGFQSRGGSKFAMTEAAFSNLLDNKINYALGTPDHALVAQHVRANSVAETQRAMANKEAETQRANSVAETQRANKEAETQRANSVAETQRALMEAQIQRVKMESEAASARATLEHERERRVEQSRFREAEEDRNRKERERAAEQLAYDRSQLADARMQLQAETMFMRQTLNTQQSVQATTLGMSMSSNYYAYQPHHTGANQLGAHPQTQALGLFAPAPAVLQPFIAHISEEPAVLRLTDTPKVPNVLGAATSFTSSQAACLQKLR